MLYYLVEPTLAGQATYCSLCATGVLLPWWCIPPPHWIGHLLAEVGQGQQVSCLEQCSAKGGPWRHTITVWGWGGGWSSRSCQWPKVSMLNRITVSVIVIYDYMAKSGRTGWNLQSHWYQYTIGCFNLDTHKTISPLS